MSKISVLGAGSFGTALAERLASNGHEVVICGRNVEDTEAIGAKHENPTYFPGIKLSEKISARADFPSCVRDADLVVIAVPAQAVRELAREIKPHLKSGALIVSTSKGLEEGSAKRMSEVLTEELGTNIKLAVFSGPNFALELIKRLPMAGTVASSDRDIAKRAAEFFHAPELRLYTTTDVIGVELGGVIKNAMAIAVGISDGLGMGAGARAALITRGLAEMTRLIMALGGKAETVSGLSGLGDLLLTATTDLSRNRRVGLLLGQGKKLDAVIKEIGQVVEGVKAAETVLLLAKRHQISIPIIEQVNQLLQGTISPQQGLLNLMSREPKSEHSN